MPRPQSWYDHRRNLGLPPIPAVFADETAVGAFEAAARQRKAFDELMTLVARLTAQNTALRAQVAALTEQQAESEPEDLFRGEVS